MIPDIGVSSTVNNLMVIEIGDQQVYEDPENFVGFIPASSGPGATGGGWYFGHLSNLGIANVFSRLHRIAALAREDPVDIFIDTPSARFLYRVSAAHDVPRAELEPNLYEPSLEAAGDSIFLCTCWPPNNFSRRVVVEARLVAVMALSAEV